MWKKKAADKNEKKPVNIERCFICGVSLFEYMDGDDIVTSIRSGNRMEGTDNWHKTKPKLNYLLPCPNCQRHYCVKHEDMILRNIGKCKECTTEN